MSKEVSKNWRTEQIFAYSRRHNGIIPSVREFQKEVDTNHHREWKELFIELLSEGYFKKTARGLERTSKPIPFEKLSSKMKDANSVIYHTIVEEMHYNPLPGADTIADSVEKITQIEKPARDKMFHEAFDQALTAEINLLFSEGLNESEIVEKINSRVKELASENNPRPPKFKEQKPKNNSLRI